MKSIEVSKLCNLAIYAARPIHSNCPLYETFVIFLAQNREGGDDVAVKFEPVKTKFPQLYYEAKLYRIFDGAVGVPQMYYFG